MISRIIDCHIRSEEVDNFRNAVTFELLPQIKQEPGFVDAIESLDLETGHYVSMTLWESRADVQNYDAGLFRDVASKLLPMMSDSPQVSTLEVDNSTLHHIVAGKAAAA